MFDYEEACPVSKAASVLCERWTLQIIREMSLGATRFSEFRQYLPKMSPTLLNTRLKTLEEQGIIVRRRSPEKRSHEYQLTPCGKALKPVLREFGKWGMHWAFDSMNPEELNVSAIIRDFAVALRIDQLPAGDTTIQFNVVGDDNAIHKYILVRDGKAQVCEDNIGYDVDVYLTADIKTLGQIWYGDYTAAAAREKGLLKVTGTAFYVNNIGKWLGTSQFAPFNTKAPAAP